MRSLSSNFGTLKVIAVQLESIRQPIVLERQECFKGGGQNFITYGIVHLVRMQNISKN